MRKTFGCLALQFCLVSSAVALTQSEFSTCVQNLKIQARKDSLSDTVVNGPLSRVELVPRVIELDRAQPEFSLSFYKYYTQRVTEKRVERGRSLLKTHKTLLKKLEKQYGVPAHYLVSFWGMETNFGSYLGRTKTLDALTTLACDKRRRKFFTRQLFDALHLIDSGVVDESLMVGSWAGAMGNMQFMPSTYRQYGRDGNKDGSIDMWGSLEDAFTSAAHYLNKIGWEKEWRWGREVRLPKGFNYAQAGRETVKSLREWAKLGVVTIWQQPLPNLEDKAALVVPSGHKGPAFLVYQNFNVIMKWNRSEFYALSVGILADRIKGGTGLAVSPPATENISIATIKKVQSALKQKGFDIGTVDGIPGAKTRRAIRDFQIQKGMVADGFLHSRIIEALL